MEFQELILSGEKAQEFARLMQKFQSEGGQKIDPDIMAHRLKDHLAEYQKPNEFQPGQIVTLKPSFDASGCFRGERLAIVVDMLAKPIYQTDAVPSNEQGAHLDIRVMWVCPDHGQVHFGCFESALFQPWMNGTQNTQP